MKKSVFLAVALIFVLFTVISASVLAYSLPYVPPTPWFTQVYGKVWIHTGYGLRPAPIGTVVEVITPRGEVAGAMLVGSGIVPKVGILPFTSVFGEDITASPRIPGFRPGEKLRFRVNGRMGYYNPFGSKIYWQNDWTKHWVDIYFF